jgi:hypothetical protein
MGVGSGSEMRAAARQSIWCVCVCGLGSGTLPRIFSVLFAATGSLDLAWAWPEQYGSAQVSARALPQRSDIIMLIGAIHSHVEWVLRVRGSYFSPPPNSCGFIAAARCGASA